MVRPVVAETTALGAAYAAGLAVGYFPNVAALRSAWRVERKWEPAMEDARRQEMVSRWHDAVKRSLGQAE